MAFENHQQAAEQRRGGLHLIKLSVGSESVESLREWQTARSAERAAAGLDTRPRHVTRMTPKRRDELLDGGSIFWIIQGEIVARQPFEAIEPVTGADGIARCALILSQSLITVQSRPRRPFQGWRYLTEADAPPDLDVNDGEEQLPKGLREELTRFGLF